MFDYDKGVMYIATDTEPNAPTKPILGRQTFDAHLTGIVYILLETKWFKPKIISAHMGRSKNRDIDIVQTEFNGERLDFTFDKETHLTNSVSNVSEYNGKTFVTIVHYSDYTEVDGIKMPRHAVITNNTDSDIADYNYSYQFNVKYNEDIFLKPPPIDAGPKAWKVKRP